MSSDEWRWADPAGQQRRASTDELRAALAAGTLPPNTPVWRHGWKQWQSADAVIAPSGPIADAAKASPPSVPPPPLAVVAAQHDFEAASVPPPGGESDPPPPPTYVPRFAGVAPESIATSIGVPVLPQPAPPVVPAPASVPKGIVEELSGSVLVPDEGTLRLKVPEAARPASGTLLGMAPPANAPVIAPPSDPLPPNSAPEVDDKVHNTDPGGLRAVLHDVIALRPKNRLVLPVFAVLGAMVSIGVLSLIVSAVRAKPSEIRPGSSGASELSSARSPTATPSVARSIVPIVPPPVAFEAVSRCTVAGASHVVAPHALVPIGVEAVPYAGGVALGFAVAPRDAIAVRLDASTLAASENTKTHADGPIRRVVPVPSGGKLAAAADTDRKADRVQGRRTVSGVSPIDVGAAEGGVVWAPHQKDSYAKLVALEGEGPVEALRGVPLPAQKGYAITFRRGGAIWLFAAFGEAVLVPKGPAVKIAGLGAHVGSPAIAVSGDSVVVAWADRGQTTDPWSIRWAKWTPGEAAPAPSTLKVPPGGLGVQAMSPSVIGFSGGRFLLTWTEGPVNSHQVRAQLMNGDGAPVGGPLTISAEGVNAGQAQAAMGDGGRGAVAFLAAKGKGYEVVVTPIACAP